MFKVNNTNTRTRCGICSKLTIKTRERGVVLVTFLLTFNIITPCFSVFIVNFEQVNAAWDTINLFNAIFVFLYPLKT